MGLMSLLAAPASVLVSASAKEGSVMLVVAAPWRDAATIISDAGADIIGPQTSPFAAFAASEAAGTVARLKRAGAWAVLDGQIISQMCGV